MAVFAKNTRATVIPCMSYRDAAAAIDWLCDTFGFEKQAVYPADDGTIMHAQLTFGNGMIMCGTKKGDTPFGRLIKQPDEIGGAETQGCYLMVSDADAYYARAKASGAEIILEIQDDDFGGRSYACRDPEGHIWNFGTYDPWQGKRAAGLRAAFGRSDGRRLRRLAMVGAGLAAIVTSAVAGGT